MKRRQPFSSTFPSRTFHSEPFKNDAKRARTETRHPKALSAFNRNNETPHNANSSGNKEKKFLEKTTQEGVGFSDRDIARKRVRDTLRLFRTVRQSLKDDDDDGEKNELMILSKARTILLKSNKFVNTERQSFGSVPGIDVGDEFRCWMELKVVGLHYQLRTGIDYVNHEDKTLAVSVVSSGQDYGDEIKNVEVLVYTGEGGNLNKKGSDKEPKDQEMKCGNLALKNSSIMKNPVRVIIKPPKKSVYVYCGLYEVENFWNEIGPHGMKVFKFQMRRLPRQDEVGSLGFKKPRPQIQSVENRKGFYLPVRVPDISNGKEAIPVCVVNTVDAKIPFFKYLERMVYPNWFNFNPDSVLGCDCVNGCSDSKNCCCAVRNGGRIPFDRNGASVGRRTTLVYECGPHCKCPPTCKNRVSQNGIKLQLEIFRTKNKGWSVRCPSSIPYGSFVCEYTGKLVAEAEFGRRNYNCDYLFEIGNKSAKASTRGGFEDGGFAIDAANSGNVGRFINHSYSPNLFALKVLYDHGNGRVPHVMLFAGEDIPRMQELTYNYTIT